jgi:hypothetical protein
MINPIKSDYDGRPWNADHTSLHQPKKLPEKLSTTREQTLLNVKDGGPRPLTVGQCCAKCPHQDSRLFLNTTRPKKN